MPGRRSSGRINSQASLLSPNAAIRRIRRSEGGAARGAMTASDYLARFSRRPVGELCRNGDALAEALLAFHRRFQPDLLVLFSDVYIEAEALGLKLEFSDVENPTPLQTVAPTNLRPREVISAGRTPELLRAADRLRRELGGDFPILYSLKDPFSLAALTVGTDLFLQMLVTDPGAVDDIIAITTACQKEYIRTAALQGFIPFIGAPMASGSMIGPRWFRRFAASGLEALFNVAVDAGQPRSLHLCGEIAALEAELRSLNLDLISFEDWAPGLFTGGGTTPMGWVPTPLLRSNAPLEPLRAAISDCLAGMPDGGILCSACDLPPDAGEAQIDLLLADDSD